MLALGFALCLTNVLCASDTQHDCAAILDDANRLACYDRAFGSPHAPANGAKDGVPAAGNARQHEAKKDFSFTAVVRSLETRRDGLFAVTLDNEQVWVQTEANSRIDLRIGAVVNVRRGALGSYLLSNSSGITTRVKRLR